MSTREEFLSRLMAIKEGRDWDSSEFNRLAADFDQRARMLTKALNLLSTFRDHGALCGDGLVLNDVEEIDAFLNEVSTKPAGA